MVETQAGAVPALEIVCGVDEAGRGPLAGAVFAAAVILDPLRPIAGLRDSKQLSERRREALAPIIQEQARGWAVASASATEIDALNILQATMLAMQRAVALLPVRPTLALVDGNRAPVLGCPVRTIVRGDQLEACISAASILAKTARDASMQALAQRYPQYHFERHKGYPTLEHRTLLSLHGPCPEHRRSFQPVRALELQKASAGAPS